MSVKRIVANIETKNFDIVKEFYKNLFDLDVLMDLGWIVTLGSDHKMRIQLSFMSEGGSGAIVPDLSIEVEDVDEVYQKAKKSGYEISYELTDEPWGVRRFYLTDPLGKTLNVLSHSE